VALPDEEWLHLAKRAPINGSARYHHLRESRPNLVVRNLQDRYTAFCMACKQGAVHMKEHVKVTGLPPPAKSHDLTLPHDMQYVLDADQAVRDGVLGFLAVKHMDSAYFDSPLMFSKERMRLLVHWCDGWLGRDTTGRSPQKWLTFNGQKHLDSGERHSTAIVVEDPFSFFKVRWALRGMPFTVYSSLGTQVPNCLMLKLLEHNQIAFFYDGDEAGYKGAARGARAVRGMGLSGTEMCAPPDHDPKDLIVQEIQAYANSL